MPVSPRAWYESAAFDGLAIANYISDSIQNQEDNHYYLGPLDIAGIIGRGANLAEIQLNRSSDRVPILESNEILALAADFTAEDLIPIHQSVASKEKLSVQCDNANNNEATGVVLLVGGKFWVGSPPTDKPFQVIQITSTTAAVAGVLTALTLVYPSDLPGEGKIVVYGMRAKSASGYMLRFLQDGRPGVPTQHAAPGPFIWFEKPFEIDLANKPSAEILSSTTTAAHVIELACAVPKAK